jgi:hypothetical protein
MRRTPGLLPSSESSRLTTSISVFGDSAPGMLSSAYLDAESILLARLQALSKAIKSLDDRVTTIQRQRVSASGAPAGIETAYITAVSQQYVEQRTAGLTKHASLKGIT